MAVVLDAVDGGTSSTSTITSAGASPNGSDRLMLVAATGRSAADDVKYGGSGGTSIDKISSDVGLFFSTWFGNIWATDPNTDAGPSGSTTGWVDFGSGTASAFSIVYLEGVDQTTPYTTAQIAGPTTSSTPSLAFTGLTAGQVVYAAIVAGNLPTAITGFTENGSTTEVRADYSPVDSERQSVTLWLSGTADGSGNVTLGGTFTGGVDVCDWYMYGFGINEASGGDPVTHPSTGALEAQAATVAGTASRTRLHPTTGALAAQAAVVAGSAIRTRPHPSSGALVAGSATVAGDATRTSGPVTHPTTGALEAQAATVAGSAVRTRLHPSSGALEAQAATLAGSAIRTRPHPSSGALEAQAAVVAGDAQVTSAVGPKESTGALQAQAASVSGEASIERLPQGGGGGRKKPRYRVIPVQLPVQPEEEELPSEDTEYITPSVPIHEPLSNKVDASQRAVSAEIESLSSALAEQEAELLQQIEDAENILLYL